MQKIIMKLETLSEDSAVMAMSWVNKYIKKGYRGLVGFHSPSYNLSGYVVQKKASVVVTVYQDNRGQQ